MLILDDAQQICFIGPHASCIERVVGSWYVLYLWLLPSHRSWFCGRYVHLWIHVFQYWRSIPECDVCGLPGPDVCCLTCDPKGVPYHGRKECWEEERQHRKEPEGAEFSDPSASSHRLSCTPPLPQRAQRTDVNTRRRVQERQVERLHQIQHIEEPIWVWRPCLYPSFVSFIGPSMQDKSFLIHALQNKDTAGARPSPIPSLGKKRDNYDCTSSNIHLRPGPVTVSHESPILFLGCEGSDGTDIPSSLKAESITPKCYIPTTCLYVQHLCHFRHGQPSDSFQYYQALAYRTHPTGGQRIQKPRLQAVPVHRLQSFSRWLCTKFWLV